MERIRANSYFVTVPENKMPESLLLADKGLHDRTVNNVKTGFYHITRDDRIELDVEPELIRCYFAKQLGVAPYDVIVDPVLKDSDEMTEIYRRYHDIDIVVLNFIVLKPWDVLDKKTKKWIKRMGLPDKEAENIESFLKKHDLRIKRCRYDVLDIKGCFNKMSHKKIKKNDYSYCYRCGFFVNRSRYYDSSMMCGDCDNKFDCLRYY